MILFSDLDRTIIHPIKLLAEDATGWEPVENFDGRDITCMSLRALDLLAELADRATFVPVTTRSAEQLGRLGRVTTHAKFSICANGATITRDGQIDETWQEIMAQQLRAAASLEEAQAALDDLLGAAGDDHWLLRWRAADDRFLYAICDLDKTPDGVEQAARDMLEPLGWTAFLHTRKFYALPKAINKRAAAAHLRDRLQGGFAVGAGDSEMDRDLVQWADEGWVPSGSELAAGGSFPGSVRLASGGHIAFTEEMLDSLLERLR